MRGDVTFNDRRQRTRDGPAFSSRSTWRCTTGVERGVVDHLVRKDRCGALIGGIEEFRSGEVAPRIALSDRAAMRTAKDHRRRNGQALSVRPELGLRHARWRCRQQYPQADTAATEDRTLHWRNVVGR